MPETTKGPVYKGMVLHSNKKGGFALWLPSDWHQIALKPGHVGFLFSPYPNDVTTCILAEKYKLKFKVNPNDVNDLREGFKDGLKGLPGINVETMDEALSDTIQVFDARYTFLEDGERRKRWIRNIYWGNAQLLLIAQGRTPEMFDYWLPMFFNTISTTQIL